MIESEERVSEYWGLSATETPMKKLAERYSRYIEEMIYLQKKLMKSDVRKPTRVQRLWDLKLRLIPEVEAQLQR
jgi:hypothetical protein